jgi:hypothetical protein
MKRILAVFLIATVSLFGVGITNAEDLVATWSMKDGPLMTIELQDQDNFRMNMGADSYILMSQGKGYMVSKEKGEWVATSMESMKKMMEMSGIGDLMARMGEKHVQDDRPPRFEKTGRVETLAGIKGQVYRVSMDNAMGKPETVEMVFGEDSRLVRLHQAQARWAESSGIMGGRGGPSYSELMKKYAKNGPGGAMLRYADVMKLESIQEAKLADSRFRVPRIKEMDMGSLGDIRRQSPNRQGQTRPSETIDLEGELQKERIRRQAERKEAEKTETELGQDDVMEGVNSLLKGLFGN